MARPLVTADMVVEYSEDIMGKPFVWGECDCCSAACDVFLRLWGVDPMAGLRGSYSSRRGAYRNILVRGGMERMCVSLAVKAGLVESEPTPGALGVTEDKKSLLVCASPGLWLGKGEKGMVIASSSIMCWTYDA